MRKLNFIQKIFFFINLLVAFSLLLAYGSAFISPQTFWVLAFFGLVYPVILLINIGFIIFWLLQKKWLAILSLIIIGIGINHHLRFFAFNFSKSEHPHGNPIRIMTYNVKNFNLYHWKNNREERKKMMQFIREQNPDIVCFQEFYSADSGYFRNIREIQDKLGLPYYSFEKIITLKRTQHWGLSVFSKYPILRHQSIKFNNTRWNGGFYADLQIGNQTVRLYNIHFESVHFLKRDYEYIEQLTEEQNPDLVSSKKILYKLKQGFNRRAEQAEQVADSIRHSPYPVIVCGDFNDHPVSYSYRLMSANLQDAFAERGLGIGRTYTGFFAPFRIDYILLDKKIQIHQCKNVKKDLSDHYPVVCECSL